MAVAAVALAVGRARGLAHRTSPFDLSPDRTFENLLTSILNVLASFARPCHVRPFSKESTLQPIIAVRHAHVRAAMRLALSPLLAPYQVRAIREAACLLNFPSLLRGLPARGRGGGGGGIRYGLRLIDENVYLVIVSCM